MGKNTIDRENTMHQGKRGLRASAIYAIAFIILGLVVISAIPVVMADQNQNDTNKSDRSAGDRGPRTALRDGEGPRGDMIRAQVREQIQDIRAQFEQRREELKTEQKNFQDIKKEWQDLRFKGELKKPKLTNETINLTRQFLLSADDVMVAHLNAMRAQVAADPLLTNETKADLESKIDAKLATLEDLKTQIGAASTKEELADLAKKLQDQVRDNKLYAKRVLQDIELRRLGNVITKAEEIGTRVSDAIAKIEANATNSTNTSRLNDLKAKLADYNGKVALAKDKDAQAAAKFNEALTADNTTDKSGLVQEAQSLMKEARDALNSAQGILREMVRDIAQLSGRQGIRAGGIMGEREGGRPGDEGRGRGGPGFGRNSSANESNTTG